MQCIAAPAWVALQHFDKNENSYTMQAGPDYKLAKVWHYSNIIEKEDFLFCFFSEQTPVSCLGENILMITILTCKLGRLPSLFEKKTQYKTHRLQNS